MTRTALIACLALAASAATPALAGETPKPVQRASDATQRIVMMCDADAATQRAFRREHGARPVFVTAEQVLTARASGERWATPRCMTADEHQRLTQRLNSRASL